MPRVGAGADEDPVDRDVYDRRARLEAHVFQRFFRRLSLVLRRQGIGIRHGPVIVGPIPGWSPR